MILMSNKRRSPFKRTRKVLKSKKRRSSLKKTIKLMRSKRRKRHQSKGNLFRILLKFLRI